MSALPPVVSDAEHCLRTYQGFDDWIPHIWMTFVGAGFVWCRYCGGRRS